MQYKNICEAIFIERPNRFISLVKIGDAVEIVHVKNTGRCRELLIPGVKVILCRANNENRKTKYDLIAVYKQGFGLINIDSQLPNAVVKEWLAKRQYTKIIPEYSYGKSRIDFYMERGEEKFLMEVKGCTLEKNGIGFFPDAPTERGVRHIYELIDAKKKGINSYLAFVIQMEGIAEVRANIEVQAEFGVALNDAEKAGVKVICFVCDVSPDSLVITGTGDGDTKGL